MLIWLAGAAGCADHHSTGPEAWWHEAIGGKIAEQRPPPPGDKDPFPNLATVPAKPASTDAATWNRMTAGLITDRIKAREAAALAPIPAPASPPGTTVKPDQVKPWAGDQGASAALAGATSKTTSPPSSSVLSGLAATKASPSAAAQPPPPALPPPNPGAPISVSEQRARVANGPLPPLPGREPPRPNIAPGPPPPLVPVTAAPPMIAARVGTEIDFARHSAALNDAALAEVKAIAAERGDHGIAIIGYGDASSSDALGQAEALDLGLRRAQALATAIVAQGVPNAFLRLNAEAAGRGASLRLLQ